MGKNLDMKSMDNLVSGLVKGQEVPQEPMAPVQPVVPTGAAGERRHEKVKIRMERVCTLVDAGDMVKIRTIAENENIAIKELFALGLSLVIQKYEELHGKIRVKRTKKGDLDKIFNI